MSTMEEKIEVITEFLENRAQRQLTTNFQDVQTVAGVLLFVKGYRHKSTTPVRREHVATALSQIAATSYQQNQILLPAVVTHYADANPTHEFAQWATTAGLMDGELGDQESGEVRETINAIHPAELAKVFAHYASVSGELTN